MKQGVTTQKKGISFLLQEKLDGDVGDGRKKNILAHLTRAIKVTRRESHYSRMVGNVTNEMWAGLLTKGGHYYSRTVSNSSNEIWAMENSNASALPLKSIWKHDIRAI